MLDRGGRISKTPPLRKEAGVAELVDARDSKSRSLGSMGSIPIAGISLINKGLQRISALSDKAGCCPLLPLKCTQNGP